MKSLFLVRHRYQLVWIGLSALLLASAGLSGCFKAPDPGKLQCKSKAGCPADYFCSNGMCKKGSGAGGSGGGSGGSGRDDAGSGGSTGSDGPNNGGAGGGPIDVPYGSGAGDNGASCTMASDCNSNQCVDSVCCESECKGTCMACTQISTGKPDGTCAPVATGKKDPHDACKDETGTNQCGSDGFCDGAGACRKVGTDHVCATASCNTSFFTPTSTCDGKGACKAVAPIDCGTAPCDIVDGCRSACAADKDCSGGYCNMATGRCAAQKIAGDSCGSATECASGFCVDGVCCDKACTEKCMACSNSLTTAKSGICSAVKVGTDPHESCAADAANQCGLDGTCDGAGACRMAGADQMCKPATCTAGSFVHAAKCDGKGSCGTPLSESCGAFTCDATSGCQKACAADTDCTGKSYCDAVAKTCTAQKDNGKVCTASKECISGNCVDGLCCNSKCDGACSSCKKEHTNVADGTCASVVAAKDPYNSCSDDTATNVCGNTGFCDGAGACQKVEKNKACGTASCSGATFTPASQCDGLGACKTGSPTNCGDYQCSVTTGCLTTCTGNADCSTATYCDTTLAKPVCTPKKKPGEACGGTDGSKCTTGKCVNGVCCTTDSCPSCYACNVNSSGTCAAVGAGTVDPKGVCTASTIACGQDGKCDGSGNCTYSPAVGATCSPTTCTGSTKTTNACNSAHTCAATTSACPGSLKCNGAGTDCLAGCTGDSDCVAGQYCSTGSCKPKMTPGTSCSAGSQCASGNCADGVCCNTACTEQCKACNIPGSAGTCTRISNGPPVHGNPCNGTDTTCRGYCNGGQDTCFYPSGQCGGNPSCSSDLRTKQASSCSAGSCLPNNQDCSTTYCDATTTSCASSKKTNTSSCSQAIQCTSGICSNNVCCGTGATGCGGNKCCTSGQTCYNGSCCSPDCTNKCSGLDGCGGTCPNSCSGATPHCVSGSCKQCSINANCTASGYTICSPQYTCTCDQPSAANFMRNINPGFDQNLNGWTSSGAFWNSTDASGCSWSGSAWLLNSGQIDGCVPLPSTANGSTNYVFGLMAKGTGVNCLIGGGYASDFGCTNMVSADWVMLNVPASNSWAPAKQVVTPPSGTNSVGIACMGADSNGYIDNLYFDLNQPGNGF